MSMPEIPPPPASLPRSYPGLGRLIWLGLVLWILPAAILAYLWSNLTPLPPANPFPRFPDEPSTRAAEDLFVRGTLYLALAAVAALGLLVFLSAVLAAIASHNRYPANARPNTFFRLVLPLLLLLLSALILLTPLAVHLSVQRAQTQRQMAQTKLDEDRAKQDAENLVLSREVQTKEYQRRIDDLAEMVEHLNSPNPEIRKNTLSYLAQGANPIDIPNLPPKTRERLLSLLNSHREEFLAGPPSSQYFLEVLAVLDPKRAIALRTELYLRAVDAKGPNSAAAFDAAWDAILHEDALTLTHLLGRGLDPLSRHDYYQVLFFQAIRQQNHDLIQAFLDHHVTINTPIGGITPLQRFSADNPAPLPVIRYLLKAGADTEAHTTDRAHFTAVHLAIDGNQLECLKLLLEFKADPNARAGDGRTPLDLAESLPPQQSAKLIAALQPYHPKHARELPATQPAGPTTQTR